METPSKRSPYRRNRVNRGSVKFFDKASTFLITFGGLGVILVICLVFVFLGAVTIPLFLRPSVERESDFARQESAAAPLRVEVNEYRTLAWTAQADMTFSLIDLTNGKTLSRLEPFKDAAAPTAWCLGSGDGECIFGFADGSVRSGSLGFSSRHLEVEDVPEEFKSMKADDCRAFGDGMLTVTQEGQFRKDILDLTLEDPVMVSEGQAIQLIDLSQSTMGPVYAILSADSKLRIVRASKRKNLLTGKVTVTLTRGEIDVEPHAKGEAPFALWLSGLGDNMYLAWRDGVVKRYDSRDYDHIQLAEELDTVEEPGETITAGTFLLGKSTLILGDSLGRVRAWFRIKPEFSDSVDGSHMACAHELPRGKAAVTSLSPSSRSRILVAGFADGGVKLYHVTSNQAVFDFHALEGSVDAMSVALTPKDDGIAVLTKKSLQLWDALAEHPETSLAAIYAPVWYEGFDKPAQVWQSSSGTDDFEPKYGLYPLVFGSIKATFYSLLFGVPLALCAAVYTSEFMHPSVKARVKPTIELMASLPSVVLGFLAALVVAPMVEDIVPQTLCVFITLPFAFLLGARCWQLTRPSWAIRWQGLRPLGMAVAFLVGLWLAWELGPVMENVLFHGDVKAWLNGDIGTGLPGWMLLFMPLSALAVTIFMSLFGVPWMRRKTAGFNHAKLAVFDLFRFCLSIFLCLGMSYALSWVFGNVLAWDPRGSYVDTFVQRNALVVGLLMGFAIIPIIYTISEDALSAVPNHLRAASLGSGATQWQTVIYIILPVAMSGIFSALMVGLGRAVGETMIVLMAAGNTPIMDWNIFNGFRTLSANIAVELPEAVRNSTHYRMLFLAALNLFALTFIVNTISEIIRIRFRKRAVSL